MVIICSHTFTFRRFCSERCLPPDAMRLACEPGWECQLDGGVPYCQVLAGRFSSQLNCLFLFSPLKLASCPATCFQPKVEGSCSSFVSAFYFNPIANACEAFTYGGCSGNGNRFSSVEACKKACEGPSAIFLRERLLIENFVLFI